jgi:hypothetical protein
MAPLRITRARIADLVVGIVIGAAVTAALFPKVGWLALLAIPLGPLWWMNSRGSFEKMDRITQKGMTVSLEQDPTPGDKNPTGRAA